ncbi:MAG: flagellar hook-associated protein FlgK [Rhizobiaceae bacterium]|nr:flagellar hook-associated protein FlgK [Rhizobiaceae bacterium]
MNLTSAIRTATSSLAAQSQQISNVSRNISGVGDPNYVRRDSEILTGSFGSSRVETQRYVSASVYAATVQANGNAVRAGVIATGIDQIASFQDANGFNFSPSSLLADLQRMTEFAAAAPSDGSALSSLVEQARSVAGSLNTSYSELLDMRADADKQVANSVTTINSLLSDISDLNTKIVQGSQTGQDVFDSMDSRDRLISQLSEEIGVRVIPAENNGVVLTTNSGAMLFEGAPRAVTFEATPAYGAGTAGNELRVDGVVVSGPNASLPLRSGRIAGNLEMRDNVIVGQLNQLDEIARTLVDTFAEEDQTAGGKPKLAGLFTWAGGPGVPAAGTLSTGIASTLAVNPLADPTVGGDPALIRDGVLNGDPDYLYNTNGGTGFSDRLYALSAAFDTTNLFDANAGLATNVSLNQFAEASLDQLNANRSAALDESEFQTQLSIQFTETLQSESGVNLDYEMSRLLEVERAYQASARLLSVVDQMLGTLLEATR